MAKTFRNPNRSNVGHINIKQIELKTAKLEPIQNDTLIRLRFLNIYPFSPPKYIGLNKHN